VEGVDAERVPEHAQPRDEVRGDPAEQAGEAEVGVGGGGGEEEPRREEEEGEEEG